MISARVSGSIFELYGLHLMGARGLICGKGQVRSVALTASRCEPVRGCPAARTLDSDIGGCPVDCARIGDVHAYADRLGRTADVDACRGDTHRAQHRRCGIGAGTRTARQGNIRHAQTIEGRRP